MKCRVLLFAQLVDAAGLREIDLDLPDGATPADALEILAAEHDSIAALGSRVAVAVNEQYAPATRVLEDGDTIALIPPVSGG